MKNIEKTIVKNPEGTKILLAEIEDGLSIKKVLRLLPCVPGTSPTQEKEVDKSVLGYKTLVDVTNSYDFEVNGKPFKVAFTTKGLRPEDTFRIAYLLLRDCEGLYQISAAIATNEDVIMIKEKFVELGDVIYEAFVALLNDITTKYSFEEEYSKVEEENVEENHSNSKNSVLSEKIQKIIEFYKKG